MLLLTLTGLLTLTHAYPGGAPSGTCDTMTPNHGATAQNPGTGSISITPSAATFSSCNESIKVTVTRGSGNIKGFLCQTRPDVTMAGTTGSIATGSFQNNCAGKAAITHTESSDKSTVEFTWTPSGTAENFFIVCTVVESKTIYWVKESSTQIMFTGTAGTVCESNTGSHPLQLSLTLLATAISLIRLLL